MKILVDHSLPFAFAHGGVQVQIEQTIRGLRRIGVDTDYLHWWDAQQRPDVIHYFSAPAVTYLRHAKNSGITVVATAILSEACNRPRWHAAMQGWTRKLLLSVPFGEGVKQQLNWSSFRLCTRVIVGLEAEKHVLVNAYGVEASKVDVVPLGVDERFVAAGTCDRSGDYLMTVGTIAPVKNSVELAELAHRARVPVLFAGKPFAVHCEYTEKFQTLVDGKIVRHEPHMPVEQLIPLLLRARGFVLFSRFENWSLAASEAAACHLPLLLPNSRWAHERFGQQARYLNPPGAHENVRIIQAFYEEARSLPSPAVQLFTWDKVAERLSATYRRAVGE